MKEEDLSAIKRYPIVEYLERKGIKPVRRTPAYIMYRSPLRAETHPSFKVDTRKNLWIDYGEGNGGSIIDLCMRRRAARCRKPSVAWDRPLPLMQRTVFQKRSQTSVPGQSHHGSRVGQGD